MRRPPLVAILAMACLGNTIADPLPLRQPNPALNVPSSPPPTSLSLVNAFPGLSFDAPTCIASQPGDTHRLYICEKLGKIWLIPDVTAATPTKTLFLDVAAVVNSHTGFERFRGAFVESGLLGLAFHPNYASNRYFYVFYTPGIGSGSTPPLHERLSRFTTQTANPNAADTTSEYVLIAQRDEKDNHNGGDLHFGTDGYLYFGIGDEGGQNDQELNSQRIDRDFFSGIFRIDVDKKPGNLEPNPHPNPAEYPTSPPPDAVKRDGGIARFSIPADNPYVGATQFNGLPVASGYVRTELWATGLRNPWRFSFDPATQKLWCGDVGGFKREEVNIVNAGGNYGWVYREGPFEGPWDVAGHPPAPAGFTSIDPLYSYTHDGGNDAIIGGLVYRGSRVSSLSGKYLFGDHGSGNIWSINLDGSGVERILGEGGISAFGSDPSNQDILIADNDNNRILRVISSPASSSFPDTLSETGLFSDVEDLTPAPGLLPYSVNLPFWSDHAIKRRWFTVPDQNATFTNSEDGLWTLPTGSIWVKHFDMEMERGVPESKKRIETRLIVKNAGGAYGVSYRWNAAGTEATLVEDGGDSFTLDVTENGNPVPQTWRIPSRAECMICHTQQAGHALSFNTRQLNLENDILGHSGNQLTTLFDQGYLANDPGSPNFLPRHLRPDEGAYSVEARVRSYLAVNCSYCHKAGGTALAAWDGRPELLLEETGLILGDATNNGGDSANKLVVPGDTLHSIVLNRIGVTNGFTRMPPLGSNVIDSASVDLLTTWINGELAASQSYDEWRTLKFEPDDDPAGAPGEDADGDGMSNFDEYLAGTEPLDGGSALRPQVTASENGDFTLSFDVPVNRSYHIETSDDLGQWTPWDIPGNQGLPVSGGLVEITLPLVSPQHFFRVKLEGN